MVETSTMAEAAEKLGTSRNKLFTFLRRHNIITGSKVNPEFLFMGYFEERDYYLENDNFSKRVNLISVTPKGLKMLEKLVKLLNPTAL